MRLRRVIEHLKRQQWTAVGLDLVITIIGVFIGIQVANWNEVRRDDQRSRQLLVDLDDEFAVIDKSATELSDFYAKSLKAQDVLLAALRAGRIEPAQNVTIRDALALGLLYGDPPPPSGTFRDLLSSGKLELVRDKQLRLRLIEYDQCLDIVRDSDKNIQTAMSAFYPAYSAPLHLTGRFKPPSGDGNFVSYDFSDATVDTSKLIGNDAFRVAAEQAFMSQQYRLINIGLCRQKVAAVRTLIQKGRPGGH